MFAVLAAAVFMPQPAQAGMINIIVSDMDVDYSGTESGGSLFDEAGHAGGTLTPSESDEVTTAVFEYDGNPAGVMTSTVSDQLYGDLKIDGIGATIMLNQYWPVLGSNGNAFGFDWFSDSGNTLRLNLDQVALILTPGVFFFTGTATIASQNLPFDLVLDGPSVWFSYTATLPGGFLPTDNQTATANGSGAFTISGTGTQVPEPGLVGLLIVGAISLGLVGLVRRWRNDLAD